MFLLIMITGSLERKVLKLLLSDSVCESADELEGRRDIEGRERYCVSQCVWQWKRFMYSLKTTFYLYNVQLYISYIFIVFTL